MTGWGSLEAFAQLLQTSSVTFAADRMCPEAAGDTPGSPVPAVGAAATAAVVAGVRDRLRGCGGSAAGESAAPGTPARPWIVQCMRGNDTMSPVMVEANLFAVQLAAAAVAEQVHLAAEGREAPFSRVWPTAVFRRRFADPADDELRALEDSTEACRRTLWAAAAASPDPAVLLREAELGVGFVFGTMQAEVLLCAFRKARQKAFAQARGVEEDRRRRLEDEYHREVGEEDAVARSRREEAEDNDNEEEEKKRQRRDEEAAWLERERQRRESAEAELRRVKEIAAAARVDEEKRKRKDPEEALKPLNRVEEKEGQEQEQEELEDQEDQPEQEQEHERTREAEESRRAEPYTGPKERSVRNTLESALTQMAEELQNSMAREKRMAQLLKRDARFEALASGATPEELQRLKQERLKLHKECAALQRQVKRTQREVDLWRRCARGDPEVQGSEAPTEQSLKHTLQILQCMKDVLLPVRGYVLPVPESARTRDQQVVSRFLDEVATVAEDPAY